MNKMPMQVRKNRRDATKARFLGSNSTQCFPIMVFLWGSAWSSDRWTPAWLDCWTIFLIICNWCIVQPSNSSGLALLVKSLPETLHRQFEYEDPIVRSGKQLMYSLFFKVSTIYSIIFQCSVLSYQSNWITVLIDFQLIIHSFIYYFNNHYNFLYLIILNNNSL